MKYAVAALALGLVTVGAVSEPPAEATIHVRAGEVVSHVSRYMTGACLEDVNHEVYGGLYSQMIFGESFQEPAAALPRGFRAYGGRWDVNRFNVEVEAGDGPKLISDLAPFADGEVGVQVLLPGKAAGVAGLIVRVSEPAIGADRFVGYEISLSSDPGFVRIGRHRNNWEHFKDVPCVVPADQFNALVVRLNGNTLEVLVNGKSVVTYEDRDHALGAGRIGLRPFGRAAHFSNLWVKTGDRLERLPFEAEPGTRDVSGPWRGFRSGDIEGTLDLEKKAPFVGRQCQRITLEQGRGEIGVENRGLNRWGMNFVAGKPYEGCLWLRNEIDAEVIVALENGAGDRTFAKHRIAVPAGGWRRFDFTLTPDGSDKAGRFVVKLDKVGSVVIGHAFLQPGEWGRYKGLPVRKDVAEALVAQGLTVLRYGGSMVNTPEYRWKSMLGPRDRRQPYKGYWYPYSTNGWGILDLLDFCEATGFLAVPAFNMDETPQDMADFVEYANGSADSPWGRKRAEAGHPKPYRLRHIELGNEEAVDEDYWKRFRPIAEALWAKDPGITLVVGDFAYNGRIADPFNFPGAPRIKSLAAHKKILELAKAKGRPVWFDVHVWNDQPCDPDTLGGGIIGLRDFGAALGKLVPGADFKVCVFEENAGNHTWRRGLAHAHAVNELERSGDLVPIVCAANCLQPDRQNDNGWDQGLLFLSPDRVWGQPSYYVTQMVARNYLPKCVRVDLAGATSALDVTAKANDAGTVLQLQIVNLDARPVRVALKLDGFTPKKPTARVVELAGRLDDVNAADEPGRIVPKEKEWRHGIRSGTGECEFTGHSFTILVFE